ncbi:MAG: hypothetical protein LBQ73_09600, partial [Tannerellaceae bacterium]|nr:hypothetical protein [Tannerellaceae bacterium]
MEKKIISMNFGYGSCNSPSYKKINVVKDALNHLFDSGADIVLAQEFPDGMADIYAPISNGWGTAILSKTPLERIDIKGPAAYPGTFVAAKEE